MMLTVDQTVRSYSGRSGCMCGCRGTYNEGERARKMAITALTRDPAVCLQTWGAKTASDDAGCLYVDTGIRNRVLYLTQAGVEAALLMGIGSEE